MRSRWRETLTAAPPEIVGRSAGDRRRARGDRARGRHRVPGADRRRERHRQGAGRARAPSAQRRGATAGSARVELRGARPTSSSRPSCSATRAARSPAPSAPRAGLFEEAHGGTLFLDEVSELSPRAQAKLLRVLQEREIRRVGENASAAGRRADRRRDESCRWPRRSRAGRFRDDLLFRLAVVRIRVPPLRDRVEDVPLLAHAFWRQVAGRRRQARRARRRRARRALRGTTGPATCASCRT